MINRKKLHKEFWLWQSENLEISRMDWPGWKKYKVKDKDKMYSWYFKSFACGEAFALLNNSKTEKRCELCPIDWGESARCMDDSILEDYMTETNIEKKMIMAEVIAFMWV